LLLTLFGLTICRCHGYSKRTSPNIDGLAEESLVFDRAFAAGIPTVPAITTLLTGLHPFCHGIVCHMGPNAILSEQILLLPQLLKKGGYTTVAVDNLVVHRGGKASWFARGYDQYSGFVYQPFTNQSEELTNRVLKYLHQYADEPLFLFVHYWDPHAPYSPTPPYDTMHYVVGSPRESMAQIRSISPSYYDVYLNDMKLKHPDDYAYVVAQYDGEISQVDAQVGRIVRELKGMGAWDKTLLMVVADHGECFGEGNFYFDHHGLYDAVTRVPMVMHVPGFAARRVSALISTEDVVPTLAELADVQLPSYPLSGVKMPIEDGSPGLRDYVVSIESTRQASMGLRTYDRKIIHPVVADYQGNPLPDFYGHPRDPQDGVFNVRDVGVDVDLSQTPEGVTTLEELQRKMYAWERSMLGGHPSPIAVQGLSLPYDKFVERIINRPRS